MALLLITADFPPITGGQARHLYNLWANISSQEVVVLAPRVDNSQQIDDAFTGKVLRKTIPLGEGWTARLLRPFFLLLYSISIIRKLDIKAIHCAQLLSGGFVGYSLGFVYRLPYFLYVNGADLLEFKRRFFWGNLLHRFLKSARLVFVNSCYTEELVRGLGVVEAKISLIHPAIDPLPYSKGQDTDNLIAFAGKRVVLTVGRLVERKGQDMVIMALPEIIKEIPDIHYLIVGEGPYRKHLEALVEKLGLDKYVSFAGFVPDAKLPAYYALCQVFIMPSREILTKGDVEGFGIVYLEANAAGKPVIAGKSGGVEDAVIHGHNGLLIDPCSVPEIKEAVIKLLSDDSLREDLGIKGRQRVISEFNWQKRAKDFENIISR